MNISPSPFVNVCSNSNFVVIVNEKNKTDLFIKYSNGKNQRAINVISIIE